MKRCYVLLAVLFSVVTVGADEVTAEPVEDPIINVDADDAEVMPAKPRRRGRKRRVAKAKKTPVKKKKVKKRKKMCNCG